METILDSGLTEEEMEKAVVAHNEILTSLKTVGTRILNRKKGNKVTEVWMVRREPDELDFIEVGNFRFILKLYTRFE